MALGKHKYYCEMCQKQCKDENAFAQHKRSAYHAERMGSFSERPQFFVGKYSNDFETQFIDTFKIKYGKNQWVAANRAYNELIRDPYHTHLNATRWTSLGEFCSHLEARNEGRDFMRKREVVGGIEQDMLLLIDTKALLEKQQEANKVSAKELDNKRQEKLLQKQVKEAKKREMEVLKQAAAASEARPPDKEQPPENVEEVKEQGTSQEPKLIVKPAAAKISFNFGSSVVKPAVAISSGKSNALAGLKRPASSALSGTNKFNVFKKPKLQ